MSASVGNLRTSGTTFGWIGSAARHALREQPRMHLIQILLPLFDNAGDPQPEDSFQQTERELVERFGGVTAFVRSPGEGRWKTGESKVNRDKVAICEVMAHTLDHGWWSDYRTRLEDRFQQQELVVRAMVIEPL